MTITSHFDLPAGQFALYSGMTTSHIATLEILRSTKTMVVMVVVEGAGRYKPGRELKFFKSNGRLVDYETPSLRDYLRAWDFDVILDLVAQAEAEAEVERLFPEPILNTYLVSWDRKTVVNELDDGAADLVTLGYRVVATTKTDARNTVKAYRDGLEWANEYALRGRIETITKKIDDAQDRAEASLAAVATQIQMIQQPVQQQQGQATNISPFIQRPANADDVFAPFSSSKILFPVAERPVAMLDKTGAVAATAPDHKILARPDTNGKPVILGVVGSKYTAVTNRDLFSKVEGALAQVLNPGQLRGVQVKDSMAGNGAFCERQYVFPNFKVGVGRTEVGYRVVARNSFDGGSPVQLVMGAIDFICSNGLISGVFDLVSKRHTSGLTIGVDDIANRLGADAASWVERTRRLQQWAETPVDMKTVGDVVRALPGISERRAEAILDRVVTEVMDRGENVWAVYSALTYYSSHDSSQFAVRRTGNDNVASTLAKRGEEVSGWVQSKSFQSLLLAA